MNQDRPRHGGGGYNQGGPPRPNYAAMTEYYDAEGLLKREVFVEWPRQVAESVRVSRSNMRRAYDFVSSLHFRIRDVSDKDARTVLQPGMGQFYRFVQYQAGRDRAWEDARAFFHAQCNAVGSDPKKFEGFYQLFQSVMAYLRR